MQTIKDYNPFNATASSYSSYLYCPDLNCYIFFPSMPEGIDISRENDFAITTAPLYPDGLLAIYQGGQPISVPVSFLVSAHDPVCINGPITLIDAAKALHAMALPQIPNSVIQSLPASATIGTNGSDPAISGGNSPVGAAAPSSITGAGTTAATTGTYYMPPLVTLMLFEATTNGNNNFESSGTGIMMNGFLKSVKVTPRGPWLKAQGFVGRLPSSMEYSFTFTYFPSYQSTITLGQTGFVPATTTGTQVATYFFGENAPVFASGGAAGGASSTAGTPAVNPGTPAPPPTLPPGFSYN